jgi:hypothetical protein
VSKASGFSTRYFGENVSFSRFAIFYLRSAGVPVNRLLN